VHLCSNSQGPNAPPHQAQTPAAGAPPKPTPPDLQLVARPALSIAQPCKQAAPADWDAALDSLTQWLDIEVKRTPMPRMSRLRQASGWSAPFATKAQPPVFAPWQCWSSVMLQQPDAADPALPRANWVGSYLLDSGAAKPLQRNRPDVLLMSPLPGACVIADHQDVKIPRSGVLRDMLAAAQGEARQKLVIMVDAQQRNAMVGALLLLGRSVASKEHTLDVVSVESGLCELVRNPARWDAIIVMPNLRGLVFALLAEITGIKGPWPMLWHHRTISMITAEGLEENAGPAPLDAALLIQTLALAAAHAGNVAPAQRLMAGAARMWDCGIITPSRGSVAPYVTEIDDQEFIAQLCCGIPGRRNATWHWRAIAPMRTPASGPATGPAPNPASAPGPAPCPAKLRLVSPS